MKKSFIADGILLLVAISWGLNFVIEKDVLLTITPYMYLGLRFILSAALIALVFYKKIRHITKEDIKAGLVVGLFLLLGFLTQTLGLVHTTPSKSGFITGSNVVMVPFIAYFLTKKSLRVSQIIGAFIAFSGLVLISITDKMIINLGDTLTLICAVCFALQITFTEYYVKKADPLNMAFIQITMTGIVTTIIAIVKGPILLDLNTKIWGAIAFGAIICTAGAIVIQNIAQKHTSSTHVAVILCTEAVFAGIFSFMLWGEPLSIRTLLGFSLVLAGVLITELVPLEISN